MHVSIHISPMATHSAQSSGAGPGACTAARRAGSGRPPGSRCICPAHRAAPPQQAYINSNVISTHATHKQQPIIHPKRHAHVLVVGERDGVDGAVGRVAHMHERLTTGVRMDHALLLIRTAEMRHRLLLSFSPSSSSSLLTSSDTTIAVCLFTSAYSSDSGTETNWELGRYSFCKV